MTIIIDSREGSPLDFVDCEYVTGVEVRKLNVGDYGCIYKDSFAPPIYFERKSIGDLFITMTSGYTRFKRELARAKVSKVSLILVIEGTLSKILRGSSHSTIEGITIVRKLFTLWIKYNLYPVFCKDRNEMVKYIYEYYCSIGRIKRKKIKVTI